METLSEREQHGSPDEPCASAVSVDEIVALEDRIQRTSELVRNLCQALIVADECAARSETRAAQTEEWALNAEEHVRAYAPRLEQMQNELSVLRGERDNVRQRVEDLLAEVRGHAPMVEEMQVTLKSGAFWPLVEIDIAVGVIGCLAAISWGRSVGREMDRDTVLFLCKMFGGISLGFLVIILVSHITRFWCILGLGNDGLQYVRNADVNLRSNAMRVILHDFQEGSDNPFDGTQVVDSGKLRDIFD